MSGRESTIFTVKIGDESAQFTNLVDAIRVWDRKGHERRGQDNEGGIQVNTWLDGVMIRDGWILHVKGNDVYLNPNLVAL